MSNQTALITGASGGIGYEFAKLFARDQYNLVLVARSGDKLAKLADDLQKQYGIIVKTMALDLGAAPSAQFLFDQLKRDAVVIDVLVNNAGYGQFGFVEELSEREQEILRWTADGKTSKEIATILVITAATVNFHLNRSIRKLRSSNRTHAAVKACILGLI